MFILETELRLCPFSQMSAVYPLCCSLALLGFALCDSAGGAQARAKGGAHEGRRARGWGRRTRHSSGPRVTPSNDELSRITSP